MEIQLIIFLSGFRCVRYSLDFWWLAQKDRGWEKHSSGPALQMKKKGFTEEEMMDEFIDIEIESIRLWIINDFCN